MTHNKSVSIAATSKLDKTTWKALVTYWEKWI